MVKKIMKNRSKRLTLRKKHKIEKKIREHHRKVRKSESTKKKKKDPGFPADVPFLQRVLDEAREAKERMSESERKLQKSLWKKRSKKSTTTEEKQSSENALRTVSYKDQLLQVMNEADVLLMVLDARDPIGTQCPYVDSLCQKMGKKLVYVLNKIDLVPRDNARRWLAYLRRTHPTVPFKCNTQEQSSKLGAFHRKFNAVPDDKIQKSSMCFGVKDLLSLLANYCRGGEEVTSASETGPAQSQETPEGQDKDATVSKAASSQSKLKHIKVGVVGLPNTGKSSLVNSLKRSRVCGSGNVAGTTKHCQVVTLDKHIQLIDSPGIVLASTAVDSVQLALKNMIRPDQIQDSEAVVEAIVRRCGTQYLQTLYKLPEFTSLKQFMVVLAQRFSCYEKGGVLNIEKANRILIRDWVQGKIKYFTNPPEETLTTEVLPELSAPFELLTDDMGGVEVETSEPMKTCFDEENKNGKDAMETGSDDDNSENEDSDEDESEEEEDDSDEMDAD